MKPAVADRRYEQIVTDMLRSLANGNVLTDVNPGSVVRTLVEAFAREMREVYAGLGVIWDMTHIDTAHGAGLDEFVTLLGMTRINGQFLQADAVFTRKPQVDGRVVIPAGTALQITFTVAVGTPQETKLPLVFFTDREAELQAGQDQATVPVRLSLEPGADTGTILQQPWTNAALTQVMPIAGVLSVTVPRPPVVRGYQENDDDLRRRAKGALTATGGGTARALENALLTSGLVESVAFREAAGPPGATASASSVDLFPGMLEVRVQPVADDAATWETILQVIDRHKAPGVIVRLDRMRQRELTLSPLAIRPAVANLSGQERRDLITAVQERVARVVEGLHTGEKLVWNRLVAALLQVDGVQDVTSGTRALVDGIEYAPEGGLLPADLGPLDRLVLAAADGVVVELAGEPTLLVQLLSRQPGLSAGDKATLLQKLKQLIDALGPTVTSLGYTSLAAALATAPGLTAAVSQANLRFLVKGVNGQAMLLKESGDAYSLQASDVTALDPGGPLWEPDDATWENRHDHS